MYANETGIETGEQFQKRFYQQRKGSAPPLFCEVNSSKELHPATARTDVLVATPGVTFEGC